MSERSDRDVRHSPFRLQKDRNKSVLLQRRPGFYVCHYIRSVRVRARVILHSLCPMQVDVACADVEQGRDKPCPYYATVGKLMLCAG